MLRVLMYLRADKNITIFSSSDLNWYTIAFELLRMHAYVLFTFKIKFGQRVQHSRKFFFIFTGLLVISRYTLSII